MDQSPTTAQRYQPLPDGAIRLLSLLPSTDPTAQITCSLYPHPLTGDSPSGTRPNNSHDFEALSYVWGTDPPAHTVLVDGHPVPMRANLHDALKELRLPDTPRALWVDSVCINQADIGERNAQVKMMGQIYASAKQVIVWLGRGDGDTDTAMDFVRGLERLDPATAARLLRGNDGPLLPWEDRQKVFHALGMVHGLGNYKGVVGGLVKLMEHAWWRRMWTVQEIVLAASATLRCGGKSAGWSHLGMLVACAFDVAHYNTNLGFGRPMDEAVFDEMTGELLPLYTAVSGLNNLSRGMKNGMDVTLEQMAWSQLLARQATDPRDMIYALLGLLSPAKRTVIEIDYGKDMASVYTSAMKAMILEYRPESGTGPGPLHLLQDSYLERSPALPSWVPDFGILHSFRTTTLATSARGSALVLESEPLYNASLGDDTEYRAPIFFENDAVLEMEGVSVDHVEELGDVCPRFPTGWERRQAQLRDVLNRWRELLRKRASARDQETEYIGGGSSEEAFWRTVTLDSLLTDRDYFAGALDRRDTRLPRGTPGMPPKTADQEAEIMAGIVDAPVPKTVLEKLGERRFFITKTGWSGLGPPSMQVNDMVCVLRGGFFPTVIQPATDNRYIFVGECFVQGIMDGEMISAVKKGMVSWQPFRFV